MKSKILLVLLIVFGFSLVGCFNTELEWFSPTDKKVTWDKAIELCSDKGGRLPTIDELKKVIVDCGGELRDEGYKGGSNLADKNKADVVYQQMYKGEGFGSSSYWSSSIMNNSKKAWVVNFSHGIVFSVFTGNHHYRYVRCVND